jgi:hypothetical protein
MFPFIFWKNRLFFDLTMGLTISELSTVSDAIWLNALSQSGLRMPCMTKLSVSLSRSLYLLLPPLWSVRHPWNALFHFSSLILRQLVGILVRGISPSQGRYLHIHNNTNKEKTQTNTHALSRIRTHHPSVRAIENSWCLRPRGQCDRHKDQYSFENLKVYGSEIRIFCEYVCSKVG